MTDLAKCPLSGINCDDCGYSGRRNEEDCFLCDLIEALEYERKAREEYT
jgi:hypothetical protein